MPLNSVYSGYVYLIGSDRFCWYKIGKCKTPKIRLRDIGILLPFKIQLIGMWRAEDHHRAEILMHEKYKDFRINGEWFSLPWHDRLAILLSPPPFSGIGVFPSTSPTKGVMEFSNIQEDALENAKAKHTLKRREQDPKFHMAWANFWEQTGLPRERPYNQICRAYCGAVMGWPVGTKALQKMREDGTINSLPESARKVFY